MPFFALPFGAEFFVAKTRLELKSAQDGFHLFAILDTSFSFDTRLVGTIFLFALSFVRKHPGFAILAQAQKIATGTKGAAGKIE